MLIIIVMDTSEVVLQEPVTKSDVEALETQTNIEDNEFTDQKAKSEKILKVVDELNDVQVCITNSLMIEDEETVDELKEKAELFAEAHVISESLVIKNQDKSKLYSFFLSFMVFNFFLFLTKIIYVSVMRVHLKSYMKCLLCL